jgi:hypothetical protein
MVSPKDELAAGAAAASETERTMSLEEELSATVAKMEKRMAAKTQAAAEELAAAVAEVGWKFS